MGSGELRARVDQALRESTERYSWLRAFGAGQPLDLKTVPRDEVIGGLVTLSGALMTAVLAIVDELDTDTETELQKPHAP
jgi:hypothetical protein